MQIVFAIPGFAVDNRSTEGRAVRKVLAWCGKCVGSVKIKKGTAAFSIDRAFRPRASNSMNAAALECLLTALTALNTIWLQYHPGTIPLYDTPVYYERTLVWDTIPALYRRGLGDCKSLTACRVAEMRRQGIWCRPVFRHKSQVSSTMFHILVMLQDGSWEDPSKALGMLSYQEEPGRSRAFLHVSGNTQAGFGLEQT
jgi:hypothetical protein